MALALSLSEAEAARHRPYTAHPAAATPSAPVYYEPSIPEEPVVEEDPMQAYLNSQRAQQQRSQQQTPKTTVTPQQTPQSSQVPVAQLSQAQLLRQHVQQAGGASSYAATGMNRSRSVVVHTAHL